MIRLVESLAAYTYGKMSSLVGSNVVWNTLMVNRNAISPWTRVLAEANGQREIIHIQKTISEDKLLPI